MCGPDPRGKVAGVDHAAPGLLAGIMRSLPFLRTTGTELPLQSDRKIEMVLLVRTFVPVSLVLVNGSRRMDSSSRRFGIVLSSRRFGIVLY